MSQDIYFTSSPYPIEVHEHLSSNSLLVGGSTFPLFVEALDSAVTISGGALTVTTSYGSFSSLEALDATASIAGGDLTVTTSYGSVTESDSLGASTLLTGGSLDTVLIQNSMLPEGVGTSPAITGGTLA